jgi:hypothetical protein
MRHPILFLVAVLVVLFAAGKASAAGVLICGSPSAGPSWLEDVRTKVAATGRVPGPVASFSTYTATPTLAQLQGYSAVMVFTDWSAADKNALGDTLASYVDSGGGVVQATFAFDNAYGLVGGRWLSANYAVFGSGGQNHNIPLHLGTVYVPGHPILAGVTSFDGGSSSYYNAVSGVRSGAIRVADWSNGVPLIATDTTSFHGRVVGLNFYPPSSDARNDFWNSRTDGAIIMANALNYAAAPEPSTLALLAAAAIGVLGFAWRRVNVTRRLAAFVAAVAVLAAWSSSANAGSVLVRSPHFLTYGYGDLSWQHFTSDLNVATGNRVATATDLSNLTQMLSYDALLLQPGNPGSTLTAAELSNLQAFIATNRRVLLMGENGSWYAWDVQVLGLVGGTYAGEADTSASAVRSNQLTAGAPTLSLPYCGLANGGKALYSQNVAALWGTNDNVLTVLDINVWDDEYRSAANNAQFGTNVANWLASPVPEPSTLALLGAGALGLAGWAWRRKCARL